MNMPNPIATALEHQRAGRVAEAEQVYKLLLQEHPNSVDALNLLGALVYEDKRFAEAQRYFETVLTLQPGAESHNSMGIVLKAQGKFAEAVEHYQQALALKPQQPEVLSNMGNALKEIGQLEEAIAAYQQALALNPNYAEAHNNLGIAYKDQNLLDEAIAAYEQAIRLKPHYAEAHHNLGIVLRLQDKLDEAIACFERSIALKPSQAEAYASLGATLQQQGKLDEAIAQYRRLIERQGDSADGFNNLALALQQQNQVEEAIAAFQKALELRPHFPGVLNNLGNLYLEQERMDEAIAAYEQAIEQRPNYPEAMNNLGNALQQKGDMDGAIAQYHRALELRPNFVETLSNLGALLKDQHKLDEAMTYLEQAIAINPTIAEIHNNLGNVYQEQKRTEDAIAAYRKAAELKPEMSEVHSNLGNMLQYIGDFEAAFHHFEQAIALQPEFAGAYNNLGIAYRNSGQVHAAFAAYERAIALKSDFVEAHWNKALNHLLLGNFREGFEGYEWRFQWSRFLEQNPSRAYPQPRWDGSDLTGKTILLYAEQGMGDTIQFIRYVPLVKAKGGRVVVECHPPLLNLLRSLTEVDQWVNLGEPYTAFDVHAPLMSLPLILGTTLETIPADVPYLIAPPDATVPQLAATDPAQLKVGLVWDGNPQNPYNRARSVPLELLLPLTDLPGLTLYSLQKEPKPDDEALLQAHPDVQDLRSHLNDFTDTAALIQQLDLVISIDTAVTHLAGALGKPTWLLLPLAPDWRWMCDRPDSPWYPTLRLFRQTTSGDWPTVIATVREALMAELGLPSPQLVSPPPQTTPKPAKSSKRKGKKAAKAQQPRPISPAPQPPTTSPPKPALADALKVVVKLYQAGQVAEARRQCQAFLQEQPNTADGWHLLGLMAHHDRQLDEAIGHYQRALEVDPNHLDTYNNLAVAFHEQKKIDEAIPYYQKALELKSDNADAHNNYANALRERGRLDEAIHHYQRAIAARPEYGDAYNNLGLAYYAKADYEQAAVAYRQALDRKPNFPQALNHLGNALKELGNFPEAAKYYQQAIALKPDYAKAYNNWGNIFRDEGDLQTAVQYYDQATAIDPNFAEAHWNKALTFLLGGDLERGFAEYEWRKHVNLPSFKSLRDFPGPRWDGSPLNGHLIFLHAEQGMGDVIQFVRYVPWVVQRGGRVILECHPPLMKLLSRIPGVEEFIPYGGAVSGYHVQAPLLSLPYIFKTGIDTVPATVPYIDPPPSDVQLPCRDRATPTYKVGLVWSGNPENPYNRTRAVPLDLLITLADLPDLEIYSLQKDLQPADLELLQAHPQIHDLRPLLGDFVDAAALIQQLDLVISVDTAVTHLAGALGKPTWLLLPYAPDWRWMIHQPDSPWYPTLRLFRQPTAGDWKTVLHQVKQALQHHTNGQSESDVQPDRDRPSSATLAPVEPTITLPDLDPAALPNLLKTALQHYYNGESHQAERLLRQVLHHQPNQADALHILGVMLCQRQQFDQAFPLMQRLVELHPEFADGWRNLGGVWQHQQQFDQAIACYQKALALEPHHADVLQNLSTVLLEVDRPVEAVRYAEQLAILKPDLADAHYNLGYALRRAGRVHEAIASYQRAIVLNPNLAVARKNLGHALLLTRDFQTGFQEMEWRWQQPGWERRGFSQPEWDGADLTGKTILLYAEQGLGDTIQFSRYVPLVQAKGGKVIVECQPELISLLSQVIDCDRWIPQNTPLPAFDTHAPLMSLPRILGTTLDTVPAPAAVQQILAGDNNNPLLSLESSQLKVGIVWAGNPNHRNDRFRSCQLDQFRPLLELPNISFFSLQKGDAAQQLQNVPDLPLHDLSDRLQSFVDTVTAIAQLDLVITVDTAVAHLAGSMGKPVWLLLMFAADWRWMCEGDHTPWYPSMRLFRQPTPGDWPSVFQHVQNALTQITPQAPHTPTPSPTHILTFPLDDFSDRGVLGTQIALHLLHSEQSRPALSQPLAEHSHVNSVQRARLQSLYQPTGHDPNCTRISFVSDRPTLAKDLPSAAQTIALVALEELPLEPVVIESLRQFRAIVVGSSWSANQLQRHGLHPVQWIFPNIDSNVLFPSTKTGLFRDRIVIFSNAIGFVKGEDILLQAFQRFQMRYPNAILLWSGATATQIRSSLQRMSLAPDSILSVPTIAYPVLGQVLRDVDIAVFPSRCESGWNAAIAASLACGIPTILSNNTGHQDWIQHNLGFSLQTQCRLDHDWGESDIEELVETLEYIHAQPQATQTKTMIAADFMRDRTWPNQDLIIQLN